MKDILHIISPLPSILLGLGVWQYTNDSFSGIFTMLLVLMIYNILVDELVKDK